ncbi:hypothetical [Yersinia pestis KIM10+]|uniref:Uncharacterized protein n=1 Tax=Yersinia pestis TaxID=632 RepID=Q8CLJ9_YERPE|nr:hypothetical [Yersinia pestis KIM10+]
MQEITPFETIFIDKVEENVPENNNGYNRF